MGGREKGKVFLCTQSPFFPLAGGGRKKGGGKDFGSVSSCEEGLFFGPPGGRSLSLPPASQADVRSEKKGTGKGPKGGSGEGERWRGWEGNVRDAKKWLLPPPPLPSLSLPPSGSFVRPRVRPTLLLPPFPVVSPPSPTPTCGLAGRRKRERGSNRSRNPKPRSPPLPPR